MPHPELAQEARDNIRSAFETLKQAPGKRPADFVKAQKHLVAAYRTLKASAAEASPETAEQLTRS